MNKSYLSLSLLFLLPSCGSKNGESSSVNDTAIQYEVVQEVEEAPTPSCSYDYTIVNKEESSMPLPNGQEVTKLRVTVEIPIEYSELGLEAIADDIKSKENNEYLFVEFYLPTQPKTGSNYGLAKRTPAENSQEINYVAPPKEPTPTPQQPAVKKPYDGCKVFGAWNMSGAKVIAYQKNGKCYMVNYYGGTNYGDPELYYKTSYRGHTAFKNAEDPADMYVINQYGDLDGYYEGDHACTFQATTY